MDSLLLKKEYAAAIEELGKVRNQAAHPGKPLVDKETAENMYRICMEAFAADYDLGLIPLTARETENLS